LQVNSAQALDITAVAICRDNVKSNPGIIDAVCRGDYQLVLVQPEFCVKNNPDFLRLTAEGSPFRRRIVGIVGDEIHLAHAWRTFRERWANLGAIRPMIPGIPVMALSATLTPYVRRFVHRSFDLMAQTSFIHRSIDRPNIYLHTRLTECTLRDFKELHWLVPKAIRHPADIHPTIIFIDSRGGCHKACSEFWNLDCIPSEWKERYPWTFYEVSTVLSSRKRTQVMAAFRAGLVRLLFATEVAGMGIDFPNVKRVIQWQVTPTLTAASLWQRFGRAARSPTVMGVAILYHTKNALVAPTSDPISRLRTDPAEAPEDVQAILDMIESYATSKTSATRKPAVDPVDVDLTQPTPAPELYDVTGLLGPRSSSSDSSISESDEEESNISDVNTQIEHMSSSGSSYHGSQGSLEPQNDQEDELSDCEGHEVYGSEPDDTQRRNKRGLPAVCRGVLWAINTTGCVRGVFLLQFDEVGLSPSDLDVAALVDPNYPCCDRHTHPSDAAIPPAVRVLLPRDIEDELTESDGSTTSDEDEVNPNAHTGVASWNKRDAIHGVLYALRKTVWRELFGSTYGIFTPYTPKSLLSDQLIAVLGRKCHSIHQESDILSVLAGVTGIIIERDLKWISAARLFEAIDPVMTELRATVRRGAPRKGRAPFVPPNEIPPEAPAEDAERIARLNAEALASHEASQDVLQSQRAKQREYQAKRKARFATPSVNSIATSLRPTRKRAMRQPNGPADDHLPNAEHHKDDTEDDSDDSDDSDESDIPSAPRRYEKRYIPADLADQLPKLPAGRPSKSTLKERHDLIDAYWASKAV
jgi:superfamily II DNA/RNA helicase